MLKGNAQTVKMIEEKSRNTAICISCMKPNDRDAAYCVNCNTPMNYSSSNDPIQRLSAEGYTYRKAAEMKPNKLVLVGVWLIFFPTFLFFGLNVIASVFGMNGGGIEGVLLFWVAVAVTGFSFLMLYRVTKNYFYPNNYWENDED